MKAYCTIDLSSCQNLFTVCKSALSFPKQVELPEQADDFSFHRSISIPAVFGKWEELESLSTIASDISNCLLSETKKLDDSVNHSTGYFKSFQDAENAYVITPTEERPIEICLDECNRKYQIFQKPIDERLIQEDVSKPVTAKTSLRYYAKNWLKERSHHCSSSTNHCVRRFIEEFLECNTIGSRNIESLEEKEVKQFIRSLHEAEGIHTAAKGRCVLNQIMNHARESLLRDDNPCTDIKSRNTINTPIHFLDEKEQQRFYSAIETDDTFSILGFIAETALSVQEVISLKRENINYEQQLLTIRDGRYPRVIPISDLALSYLPKTRTPGTPLFHGLNQNRVKELFWKCRKKAHLNELNATILRNTWALRLANYCEGKEIQDYLGRPTPDYAMRIKEYARYLLYEERTEEVNENDKTDNISKQPYLPYQPCHKEYQRASVLLS